MRVAAVDMGATSVRVAVVDLRGRPTRGRRRPPLVPRAGDRGPTAPCSWRWGELLDNVRLGLEHARESGPLASIGIDGWAVDYGLLGEDGRAALGSAQLPKPSHRGLA